MNSSLDAGFSHVDSISVALPPDLEFILRSCGADRASHSGRTLLDHLVGTYQLLADWGSPPHVCLGGLFHSVYGTNTFLRRSFGPGERLQLRRAIGSEAEALAWAFCGIDRPRAIVHALHRGRPTEVLVLPHRLESDGRGLSLTPERVCELAEIECANLIEQCDDAPALRDLYCTALSYPGALRDETAAALRSYLADRLLRRDQARARAPKEVPS